MPVESLPVATLQALRARRSELRESMAALEQALAGPAPGRPKAWAERVHVALVELSGDLRAHIEIVEQAGGLHSEVLGASPRLAGAVRRLVDDHVRTTRLVENLLAGVDVPSPGVDVDVVRARGVALLGRLARHRHAGADLIYEAYATDVGGET